MESYFDTASPLYPLLGFFVFVTGACIGSFLNVVIWRVPRGESIVHEPSHCPKCNRPIAWHDNVPILGWLLLRGRCRSCGLPISPRYPAIELLTAVLFLLTWHSVCTTFTNHAWSEPRELDAAMSLLAFLILVALLVAMTFIDLDHMLIPDVLSLPGLLLGLVLSTAFPAIHYLFWAPGMIEGLTYRPLLQMAAAPIAKLWPGLLHSTHALALLDALLGAILGGGFLFLVVEAGKLLLGRRKVALASPVLMTLTRDDYRTDEPDFGPPIPWDELLLRTRDRMRILGRLESGRLANGELLAPAPDVEILVAGETLHLGDRELPLAEIGELQVRTQEWTEPREAMGMGDVKLMAMLGAFFGAGAWIFVICLASALGAVIGLAMILLHRVQWGRGIPFGPYLAIGALVYLFYGDTLIQLYARLVLRITSGA